jgi:hypothetical protein
MTPPQRLHTRVLPGLPPLAWLAVVTPHGGAVRVYQGAAVEGRDGWVVAGTWDGEFRAGEFPSSDHFFGTGLRVIGETVYATPSSALVNRIVHCHHRGRELVSNSLALLLAFTGARLDPGHDYRRETYAIRAGEGRYEKAFAVLHSEIATFHQVSGESLVLRDGDVSYASFRGAPAIPSYARYRELLAVVLERLRRNYESDARRVPMPAYLALSAGYDSAASAVLVKDLGIRECFTARRSNSHAPRWLNPRAAVDDGTPIAARLGLRAQPLDTRAAAMGEEEAYFLAPGCAPAMTALQSLTRHIEAGGRPAVVFTGFLGDEVWDLDPKERAFGERGIVRGDTTALMLSEIELKSGFTCVPVPGLLARGIRDITALSASAEMAPWRVGGRYDRPLPRRILVEAGIPRRMFARRKNAVVNTRMYPAHPGLRREFFADIRRTSGWRPARIYLHALANRAAFWGFRGYHLARGLVVRGAPPKTPAVLVGAPLDLAYAMFGWACGWVSRRLARVLTAADVHLVPSALPPARGAAAALATLPGVGAR